MLDPVSTVLQTPVVIRPVRLTKVCRVLALVAVLVFALIGWSLGQAGDGAATFRPADQIAFGGIGVLIAGVLLSFTRARVIADEVGVRVRGLGDRTIPWQIVRQVNLVDGEPWANLDLHDDDRIALFALQSNDGERATAHVLALRSLLAASRRQDGPDSRPPL